MVSGLPLLFVVRPFLEPTLGPNLWFDWSYHYRLTTNSELCTKDFLGYWLWGLGYGLQGSWLQPPEILNNLLGDWSRVWFLFFALVAGTCGLPSGPHQIASKVPGVLGTRGLEKHPGNLHGPLRTFPGLPTRPGESPGSPGLLPGLP